MPGATGLTSHPAVPFVLLSWTHVFAVIKAQDTDIGQCAWLKFECVALTPMRD